MFAEFHGRASSTPSTLLHFPLFHYGFYVARSCSSIIWLPFLRRCTAKDVHRPDKCPHRYLGNFIAQASRHTPHRKSCINSSSSKNGCPREWFRLVVASWKHSKRLIINSTPFKLPSPQRVLLGKRVAKCWGRCRRPSLCRSQRNQRMPPKEIVSEMQISLLPPTQLAKCVVIED